MNFALFFFLFNHNCFYFTTCISVTVIGLNGSPVRHVPYNSPLTRHFDGLFKPRQQDASVGVCTRRHALVNVLDEGVALLNGKGLHGGRDLG